MLVAGSVVQSANQVQIQVQARTIKVSFVQNAVANAKLQATHNGRPFLYLERILCLRPSDQHLVAHEGMHLEGAHDR